MTVQAYTEEERRRNAVTISRKGVTVIARVPYVQRMDTRFQSTRATDQWVDQYVRGQYPGARIISRRFNNLISHEGRVWGGFFMQYVIKKEES